MAPRAEPPGVGISAVAAAGALGGHAVAIFAALLLAGRCAKVEVAPGVVSVTLVSSGGGAAGGGPAASKTSPAPAAAPPSRPAAAPALTGDLLDELLNAKPSASPAPSTRTSTANASTSAFTTGAGTSQGGQGLRAGEGAGSIDLYAGASLPMVGNRPPLPAGDDLWARVAPCWRSAAPRTTTMLVELTPDGAFAAQPRAIRGGGGDPDPQTQLAERAALRALQACAPYAGLRQKQWRVTFGRVG